MKKQSVYLLCLFLALVGEINARCSEPHYGSPQKSCKKIKDPMFQIRGVKVVPMWEYMLFNEKETSSRTKRDVQNSTETSTSYRYSDIKARLSSDRATKAKNYQFPIHHPVIIKPVDSDSKHMPAIQQQQVQPALLRPKLFSTSIDTESDAHSLTDRESRKIKRENLYPTPPKTDPYQNQQNPYQPQVYQNQQPFPRQPQFIPTLAPQFQAQIPTYVLSNPPNSGIGAFPNQFQFQQQQQSVSTTTTTVKQENSKRTKSKKSRNNRKKNRCRQCDASSSEEEQKECEECEKHSSESKSDVKTSAGDGHSKNKDDDENDEEDHEKHDNESDEDEDDDELNVKEFAERARTSAPMRIAVIRGKPIQPNGTAAGNSSAPQEKMEEEQESPFANNIRDGDPPTKFSDKPNVKYSYPPKDTLPLKSCFHNPSGYVCCNLELNNVVESTYKEIREAPDFNPCNLQKIANKVQRASEKMFEHPFETLVAHADFAQNINFAGDLVCKLEIDGKYMISYGTPYHADNAVGPEGPDGKPLPVRSFKL